MLLLLLRLLWLLLHFVVRDVVGCLEPLLVRMLQQLLVVLMAHWLTVTLQCAALILPVSLVVIALLRSGVTKLVADFRDVQSRKEVVLVFFVDRRE